MSTFLDYDNPLWGYRLENEEDLLKRIAQMIYDEIEKSEDGGVPQEYRSRLMSAIVNVLKGKETLEFDSKDEISLSFGDFLKRVWGKIKAVAQKVVNRVTHKGLKDYADSVADVSISIDSDGSVWKETRPGSGIWIEKDHPRDSKGRFTTKTTAKVDRYDYATSVNVR